MASTYSTNLAIELIGTGDQAGTWGTTTNSNLGTLIEQSISGYVTQAVSTGTDTTITIPNGSTGVARNMYIELTGTGGSNTNLVVPANKKLYFIFNNSTGAVTVKVSAQTGVSVPTGKKMVLVSNGTDIVNGLNYIADFATNSFTVTNLTASSGTITNLIATSGSITNLVSSDASATVLRAGSATLTHLSATSATITNLTLTSLVISNLSIASANITTLTSASATITNLLATTLTTSSTVTLNGGTANGVAYLNGSKVVTSGTALTFSGTEVGIINATPSIKFTDTDNSADSFIQGTDGNLRFFADDNQEAASSFISWAVDGSEQARLTSTGLGIGTTTPAAKLNVDAGSAALMSVFDSTNANGGYLLGRSSGTSVWDLGTAKQALNVGGATDFGINVRSGFMALGTGNTERARIDASGNLGLGVTPSAWGGGFAVAQYKGGFIGSQSNAYLYTGQNAFFDGVNYKYIATAAASLYEQVAGAHQWFKAASGTAGDTITFTQAMTLTAAGQLLVGRTTSDTNGYLTQVLGTSGYQAGLLLTYSGVGSGAIFENSSGALVFGNDNGSGTTERARITSGGILGVGITNPTGSLSDTAGVQLGPEGYVIASRAGAASLYVNRKTDDGDLVLFYQADTQEGSISVSGSTVSYNAFAGSHWSQLQDGSKPDILRGTVMESINELCVWPDETNERLPKSKVSDTAGSKKVYGVFMAWDNDWATTNDMYITAVGAFICRVNGSVTVQEGDLLESNGDGTARVQADDIIRSSTIGKVTSTVKTHQYADGSYCVPTVLYCG